MTEEILQILLCLFGFVLLFSMHKRDRTLRSEIDKMKTLREQQIAQFRELISDAQAATLHAPDDDIVNLRREMQGQINAQQKVVWTLVAILGTGLVAGIIAAIQLSLTRSQLT